ncbi:MAG: RNA-binding protein [Candidatus Gracilibacteria bacterium]|jgi:RNA recognition motif-containing protein|nr:RNA-binding protein [Candidatus Gracilibacteria bacterium]
MSKKLFVGNIDWNASEDDLRQAFSPFGDIEDLVILQDHMGRSKGFGFVTFTNADDADKAIEALNGKELKSRELVVNEARPPKPRRDRF